MMIIVMIMITMTIELGGGMMMQPPSPRNPDLLHSTLPYYSESQVSSLSIITIGIKEHKGQSCPCLVIIICTLGAYLLYKPARLSFSCSLDLLLNASDIDQTNINRDIRDGNWLSNQENP